MGADPTNNTLFGPNIPDEVVIRWKSYLSTGVDKEIKTKLLQKYKIPENFQILQGPKLNPEAQALLSPIEQKKNNFLLELQTVMRKGQTALEMVLTRLTKKKGEGENGEPNEDLLGLAESAQLFCIAHNIVSAHRKFQINHHFNPKRRKLAAAQPIDLHLFGVDFAERCKNANVLETTAKRTSSYCVHVKKLISCGLEKAMETTNDLAGQGSGEVRGEEQTTLLQSAEQTPVQALQEGGEEITKGAHPLWKSLTLGAAILSSLPLPGRAFRVTP
nr:unnamed protein product [Callosobruchus analis]